MSLHFSNSKIIDSSYVIPETEGNWYCRLLHAFHPYSFNDRLISKHFFSHRANGEGGDPTEKSDQTSPVYSRYNCVIACLVGKETYYLI